MVDLPIIPLVETGGVAVILNWKNVMAGACLLLGGTSLQATPPTETSLPTRAAIGKPNRLPVFRPSPYCPPGSQWSPTPGLPSPGGGTAPPVLTPPDMAQPEPRSSPGSGPTTDAGAAAGAAAAGAVGGGGGEGGSDSLATASPHMFGDIFTMGATQVDRTILARTVTGRVNLIPFNPNDTPVFRAEPGIQPSPPGTFFINRLNPGVVDLGFNPGGVQAQYGGVTLNPAVPFSTPPTTLTILSNGSGNVPNLVVLENPDVTAALQSQTAAPGEVFVFRRGAGVNGDIFVGEIGPPFLAYDVDLDYDVYRQQSIFIPSPTGGGVVGRGKVAEDNNPLPRDRVIFNYDYFNNALLTARGVDVHRITPGFEKTFFDRNASIEVRLPFAATLNSEFLLDNQSMAGRATELGNLSINFKALLYSADTLHFAAGSAFSLPTASDIRLNLADGTKLLRVRNDTVLIEPYAAMLFTPTDRFFAQVWSQFVFNANGNRVEANLGRGEMGKIGSLYDHSLLFTSAQGGYWLTRNSDPNATLTALAVFAELHHNVTLGGANSLRAGPFVIGDRRSFSELNLTVGVSTILRENFQVMAGAVVPLMGENNRTFDYQLGLRANWFFGPTAAARSAAFRASTF